MRFYNGQQITDSGNYNIYDVKGRIIGASYISAGKSIPKNNNISYLEKIEHI